MKAREKGDMMEALKWKMWLRDVNTLPKEERTPELEETVTHARERLEELGFSA